MSVWRVGILFVGIALQSACASDPTDTNDPHVGATAEALTTSVSFRRGANGTVADTFISTAEMNKSFGEHEKLRVSAKNEALLRFDLASIPSSAVINNATLTLYLNGGDDEDDDDCNDGDREGFSVVPIKIHRATALWNEHSTTYASFGQHFDGAVAGIILPTSANVFKSVDLKPLVQRWVSGAAPNDGIVIRTTSKRHTIFVSSEGQKLSLRPALAVTYTTPDDHCVAKPCQHGGVCQNTTAGFICACSPGYTGSTCETPVDNCASHPCQNGGTCTSGVNTYSCACAPGYSGATCQTNIDDCAGTPCQNGGVCTDGVNSHTCACAPGYSGANCETVINNCGSNPCQNGGTCTNGVNSFTCSCPPGFTGATCATLVDNCASNPCQNGGTCANGVNSYTCNCAPGYTGATCATLIDNCASAPCQNGGACTNGVGSYACSCAAGYSGSNCEIDINDCAGNPCANGATCVDGVNSYTCMCPAGFTGATCAINIDDCAAAPCHNGGTCTDGVAAFACTCPPGWGGATCDTSLDPCAAQPCLNGGTCSDTTTPGEYTCACTPGWSGLRCELDLSSGIAITVPWVPANPSIPHPILAGVPTTLKGRALGQAVQYLWDYGDGSNTGWLNIGTSFIGNTITSISTKRSYQGSPGAIFFARLQVRASETSPVSSAVYPMQIQDPASSPDPRIGIAIDEGLWDVHAGLSRGNGPAGTPFFSTPYAFAGSDNANCAAAAAFQRHGSTPTGSIFQDPYSDDVKRLLADMFASLVLNPNLSSSAPRIDLNGNGIVIGTIAGPQGYCGDALAHTPASFVTTTGIPQVVGRTVGDLAQDMADGVMSQQRTDGTWSGDPFASVFALQELGPLQALGATFSPAVLSKSVAWWSQFQTPSTTLPTCGGSAYVGASPANTENMVFTAGFVYASRLAGVSASDPHVGASLGFLDRGWSVATGPCASTNFTIQNVLRSMGTTTLSPRACDGSATGAAYDWYSNTGSPLGLAPSLVARQRADGSWADSAPECFSFDGSEWITAVSVSTLLGP